jgi:tetratricopeptide (TPR) repeat protein
MTMPRPLLVVGLMTALVGVAIAGRARHLEADEASRGALLDVRHDAEVRDSDIAFFERRAAADPEGANDLAMAAGLYLQRARETGANADIVRAEQLARTSLAHRHGHNLRAIQVLASSLTAQHRFVEALAESDTLVAASPDSPMLRATRAEILLELGRYDAARPILQQLRVYANDPGIAPTLAHWNELTGDWHRAEQQLRDAWDTVHARTMIPREQRAWFALRLGDLALRHGELRVAERWYHRGMDVAPGDYRLEAAEARLAAARGDWHGVLAHGGRSLETAVEPGTLGLMADAAGALGDSSGAASYEAGMLATVTGQVGPYHRQWSLHLLDRGLAVAEVRARVEAELVTRKDIYGWDVVAWARLADHDLIGARDASVQSLRLDTPDALLWYHAGRIALAVADTSLARTAFERALQVNPDFDLTLATDAHRRLAELRQ